ncbi:uncharacterized protein TRIADDRAFT_64053 [Trichoplax adhaerens]|uniref:Expressed protein n=1 Tax=Trichoplax adhaerens TaxID=10228 RepID=B3S1F0_TRIAD|nr:expressed protein [Trichoplax adhaerens]EDV23315.1 expressed protein [Trichoplax adhaerens]|eukprot:XP_002114225.1 expressed protein [Trichoplax adhaerens]
MKMYKMYIEKLFRSLEMYISKYYHIKVRFGLIGFGGDCIHSDAHFHTLNGQLKGRYIDLSSGLQHLNFTKRTNDDVVSAVKFAMQFPFESDYKSILVLTDAEPAQSADMTAMAKELFYKGVFLNVIKRPRQSMEPSMVNEGTRADNLDMFLTDAHSNIVKRGYVWNADFMTSQFATFYKSFLKYFGFELKQLQKSCFNCQCQVGPAQLGRTSCQLC